MAASLHRNTTLATFRAGEDEYSRPIGPKDAWDRDRRFGIGRERCHVQPEAGQWMDCKRDRLRPCIGSCELRCERETEGAGPYSIPPFRSLIESGGKTGCLEELLWASQASVAASGSWAARLLMRWLKGSTATGYPSPPSGGTGWEIRSTVPPGSLPRIDDQPAADRTDRMCTGRIRRWSNRARASGPLEEPEVDATECIDHTEEDRLVQQVDSE